MTRAVTIKAVVRITGVNPYVPVTAAEAGLIKPGWRKPLPVIIALNGRRTPVWRTNMMPTGEGSFYLYLHGEMRQASGIKVGDAVVVEIRHDEQYRNGPLHPVPAWFRQALEENSPANANWSKLPPSRQKEVLRYFSGLKSAEAKRRNLTRALQALEGRPTRFMGRDWLNGK